MSHPIPPSPHNPTTANAVATPPCTQVVWADPARHAAFDAWLAPLVANHQLRTETLRPASADASFRRYLRIDSASNASAGDRSTGASLIVMDAPPDKENCQPFVHVQQLMAAAGLNVPQILAWDAPNGFMLLSDLGHQTLIELLDPEKPQDAYAWYQQATDVLLQWQMASQPGVLPAYDEALLRRELSLFPEWYLAQHRGVTLNAEQQTTLNTAFDAIVAQNLAAPSVFVHRDFMTRNLMVPTLPAAHGLLPGGGLITPGEGRLGVLDFQDAVYGPITYDIASLMRDAFISWEEDLVLDITIRYWQRARKAGLPVGDDFGEFYRSVEWMGLQRHLKVAGIFARLTLRDGKPKYLADAPRFMRYIRTTADRYRQLGPLLRMLDQIEGTEPAVGFAYGRM